MRTTTIPLELSLRQLGWIAPHAVVEWELIHTVTSACWFRQWLIQQGTGALYLTPRGVDELTRLLAAGWTLRNGWPRSWRASAERWLGKRM
ncbi:MAG: hypothetical protein ABI557_05595, partial [Aureliella sp.]